MNLTNFSIERPFFIIVFWFGVIFFGIQSFINLPVSFFEKDKFLQVSISTTCPGARKEKVSEHITKNLEQEILHLNKALDIYSITENEYSEIKVAFRNEVSEPEAMAMIILAVNKATESFPKGTLTPVVKTVGNYSVPLFTVAMTSDLPPQELYNIAHHPIKTSLETVDGLSHVQIIGERQKQATIKLNLEKMKERQISASAVLSRLKEMGKSVFFRDNSNTLVLGAFHSLEDIRSFTINYLDNDRAVTLGEVADIQEDLSDPKTYTSFNGQPCLILEMYQRKNANELLMEKEIPLRLMGLKKEFSAQNISFTILVNRESNLIPLVQDFKKNIWIAIFAAFLVIWFVFKDLNSIIVSITSIPVSLCGAFCILYLAGLSLNIYTILAFIVSTGLIIDDIIIIREDIFRHLELGLSPFEATRKGMKEMMNPITGTTCMLLAVGLSMMIVKKTATTQFLGSFGVTLFSCMFFSYLEALTFGPLLCAYCLKKTPKSEPKKTIFQELSEKVLDVLHKYTRPIVILAIVLLCIGVASFRLIKTQALPVVNIGKIEIHKNFSKTPVETLNQEALQSAQEIRLKYPDIENLALRVDEGRQTFYLQMVPEKIRKLTPYQLGLALQEDLEKQKLNNQIESFEVLNNVIYSPNYIPDYTVQLSCYDYEKLLKYSDKIYNTLKRSNYLINLIDTAKIKQKENLVLLDQKKMNVFGVEVLPLANEIDILLNGSEVNATYAPESKPSKRIKPEVKIKSSLEIDNIIEKSNTYNINSKLIPVKDFASILINPTQNKETRRKNGEELIEISGTNNPSKSKPNPMGLTLKAIQDKYPLPDDIFLTWGGRSKQLQEMVYLEPRLVGLVLFFIYMTLILLYQSITLPLVILLPLPFALTGSVVALLITGNTINAFSLIGVVVTVGIAAKNGIILLKYTNQLIEEGTPYSEAIYQAVRVRLRPILMTTIGVFLTTIPVLIPWSDYSKLQFSLGIAMIGGLFTSTVVTLLIIPTLFRHTYRFYLALRKYFGRFFNSEEKEEKSESSGS